MWIDDASNEVGEVADGSDEQAGGGEEGVGLTRSGVSAGVW